MKQTFRFLFMLLLLPFLAVAQKSDNEKRWEEVERLLEIKNYEQILSVLAAIKAEAKQQNHRAEWMRAFLAESNVYRVNETNEKAFGEIQNHFLQHIEPATALEKSMLQYFYARFLEANRHEYLSESDNVFVSQNENGKRETIDSLFALALKPKALLVKEPIENWQAIFQDTTNLSLTPTLYHLLAYSYMNFSTDDKIRERLKDELLQINAQYGYNNATSYLFMALAGPNPGIDALKKTLGQQKSDYNAFILFKIAQNYLWNDQPQEAAKYMQLALEHYPHSPWIANAKNLYKEMHQVGLSIQNPHFAPSDQYTPIKISTVNTDTVFIRVHRTTNTPKKYTNYETKHDSTTFQTALDAPLVYEEKVPLKLTGKYEERTTIYKIDPLPYGRYTILMANNQDFKDDGLYLDVVQSSLTITDRFVTTRVEEESEDEYKLFSALLIDRNSGMPYANKNVQLYKTDSKKLPEHIQSTKTNEKGEFRYKSAFYRDDIGNYALFLPQEKQLIELSELGDVAYHIKKDNNDGKDYTAVNIFTDRAIYRPGQTVYFKSILYNSHALLGKVLGSEKLSIRLYDANRQSIDSIDLTTNDFGSVHGSFVLPAHTLSGSFSVRVFKGKKTIGSRSFRVEEYKRPTFKVVFDTNKETYTRQDTAVFTGVTEMLSGVPLDGATVNYKVEFYSTRARKMIVWIDSSQVADDAGRFAIKVPLMDSVFNGLESFSLQYRAEVVNQIGEMQVASGNYQFTTKPWNIHIQAERFLEENKWHEVFIVTRNQNNQPLHFAGTVNIYKMDEPKAVLSSEIQRYFKEVNYHLLDNKQYRAYFPSYFDELLVAKEEQKTLVKSYTFDGRDTVLVPIDASLFQKGRYHIEAFTIQGNDTIRAQTATYIYEPESRKISDREFLGYHLDKTTYTIGDSVTLTFHTDKAVAKTLFLFRSRGSEKMPMQVLKWKNGKTTYRFVLQKEDVSPDLKLDALLVSENQTELVSITLPIVKNDKKLHFRTTTFRNKITPGEREKWQFSITHKDHAAAAEVLATMYDVSLDAFIVHNFSNSFLQNYPYYTPIGYAYLTNAFYDQNEGKNIFDKQIVRKYAETGLPVIRSYGLWSSNDRTFFLRGTLFGDSQRVAHSSAVVREEVMIADVFSLKRAVSDAPVLYDELKDPNLRAEIEAMEAQRALNHAVNIRSNLQETAFFFPTLYTDEVGNVTLEFDSPEALTKWRLLLFAHGKNLEVGSASYFTQTQKQLMVRPNLPRYFREGDEITVKAQVQILSPILLSGSAQIEIIDPRNNQDITDLFVVDHTTQPFQVDLSTNGTVEWKLHIPADYPTVHLKITAVSGDYSDGEIHELPILPSRILITDTEKIILQPQETKAYGLKSAGKQNLQARIQVQSNPILEIIGALDYLKNYPYESNEQIVNRWFSLKMVQYIRKHYPDIAQYFKTLSSEETKGRLEENASLNELKLEEMPWLRDVQGEEKKWKRLSKLFDANLAQEIQLTEQKLMTNQLDNGAFAWFDRGKADTDISIRLLEIMGKVLYLDQSLVSSSMWQGATNLTRYLDADSSIFRANIPVVRALDYLYARQYWNGYFPLDAEVVKKLGDKLLKSSEVTAKGPAGMAAKAWVVNQLFGDVKQSHEIKNRITQEAIRDRDAGMYWESNSKRHNAVSLQSYMVEAYKLYDPTKLQAISQWLFYTKQVNHWYSTWMTVDAIYALLIATHPADFVIGNTVQVWVDRQEIQTDKIVLGQVTKSFAGADLEKDKQLRIRNENNRTIYGGIYHQYFVPAEQIQKATHGLSVEKQYFVERQGKWTESQEAKLGERVKVKITVINDQPLSYVHLKDNRPSGVEAVYRPSGYQWWQGYYFSMKDASTHYFFNQLPKGKQEYEYEIKANNLGVFRSDMTTIECLYEPTINARSIGKPLVIVE